jgi:hypothetical protein
VGLKNANDPDLLPIEQDEVGMSEKENEIRHYLLSESELALIDLDKRTKILEEIFTKDEG